MTNQIYVPVASVMVKQDTCYTNLSMYVPAYPPTPEDMSWGDWRYICFPAALGMGHSLLSAAIAGAGGLGTMTNGQWRIGSTVYTGFSSGSLHMAIRNGASTPGVWGDGLPPYGWNKGVFVNATGNIGSFRFTIPQPPVGYKLAQATIRLTSSAGVETILLEGSVGAGTFEWTAPYFIGTRAESGGINDITRLDHWYWWTWEAQWQSIGTIQATGEQRTYSASLELVYEGDDPDPECVDIDSSSITWDGATLTGGAATHWQWGIKGDNIGAESTDGILTGLAADTVYWYKALSYCEEKTFWFKTKKKDDDTTWTASIITLPATEVWATGATMHGLFHYKGNSKFYVALGFEYGLGTLTGNNIRWLYTLGQPARDWGPRGFMMPIQMTIAGLLPDTTYNFRACLHVHNSNGTLIPMNTNNYFGATLTFGGPVSMFGFGREYVTAKKAEDDISRMAAGRYYMDKEGVFQYESYQRRKAS